MSNLMTNYDPKKVKKETPLESRMLEEPQKRLSNEAENCLLIIIMVILALLAGCLFSLGFI